MLRTLLVASSVGLVSADLPVHCLRHQIQGEWEFTLGPLSDQRSSCGHAHPDNQDKEPAIRSLINGDNNSAEKLRVTLSSPDRASTPTDIGKLLITLQ